MMGKLTQISAAFITSLGSFFLAYSIAWTSNALSVLMTDDSPIGKISQNQANLVGSMPMLGSIIAGLLGCWLSDEIGRKRTVILAGLCYVLSWSIIATAPNATCLLIGRFIKGVANGFSSVAIVPFISEISEISIRGTLLSLSMAMYCCGMLMAYLFGWYFSYQLINYINLTICTAFVVLLSVLKETPAFLVEKGFEKEAIKSLQFYRGESVPTEKILTELKYLKDQKASNKISKLTDAENYLESEKQKLRSEGVILEAEVEDISVWKFLWKSKAYKCALVALVVNVTLFVFGGTIAVKAYANQLFTQASPTLSAQMCSVMLAISFAVGGILGMILSGTVGRRTQMILSGGLSTICLVMLASLLCWSWGPTWAVPAAVLGYCCFFQAGLGNVPFVQLGETFPPKLKSVTSMLMVTTIGLENFVLLALFRPAVAALGLTGAFLVFAAVCALTTAHAICCMKETKGMPQEEIYKMYEEGYLYKRKKSSSPIQHFLN